MEENKKILQQSLEFLDPKSVRFFPSPGGYLSMTLEEKTYDRVRLCRALPYYAPDRYISVCHPEEGTEYGMIADLNALPPEQKEAVEAELDKLYYIPVITSIRSAKMKMGFMEFEVVTKDGPLFFRMRDPNRNIRYITPTLDRRVQLTDCDGNRYLIPDTETLDKKSLSKIDTYLV